MQLRSSLGSWNVFRPFAPIFVQIAGRMNKKTQNGQQNIFETSAKDESLSLRIL